jgi:Ulp1 family protease
MQNTFIVTGRTVQQLADDGRPREMSDSFGRLTVRDVPEAMANIDVMTRRRGVDPATIQWRSQSLPQQDNGCDCGVFATLFAASFVASGVFVDFARFRQEHAEYARAWMLCCILSGIRK